MSPDVNNLGTWDVDSSIDMLYGEARYLVGLEVDGNPAGTFGVDYRNQTEYLTFRGEGHSYFHTDEGHLLTEIGCDSPGSCSDPSPIQDYLWLNGEPLAIATATLPARGGMVTDIGRFYVHNGLLGEPRKATEHGTTLAWSVDVPPFGRTRENVPSGSGGVSINLGFPGQMLFGPGEWHLNWHRLYWSDTGRYAQAEPLALVPWHHERMSYSGRGVHRYSYAQLSPLNYYDPDGLDVVNNSSRPVVVRLEKKGHIVLLPGETYIGRQDGVYTDDGGYKSVDFMDIVIDPLGNVTTQTIVPFLSYWQSNSDTENGRPLRSDFFDKYGWLHPDIARNIITTASDSISCGFTSTEVGDK